MIQQLRENSHRGFDGLKAALYLGSTGVKSNTAVEMQLRLRQNGIGSRSSGKERDAETGLDFFLARYYFPAQGRFMSADWSSKPTPVPYAQFNNPQTLNLYAYVRNNPLAIADKDGHGDWYDLHGKKLGKDGKKDGVVHIAGAEAINRIAGSKLIDAANTKDAYTFSKEVGTAIRAAASRTQSGINANKHEEGFTKDSKGIHVAPPGPAYTRNDRSAGLKQNANSDTEIIAHTHPAGTNGPNTMGGITVEQRPSDEDRKDAANFPNAIHMAIGVGDSSVYIYNNGPGTKAEIPLFAFPEK
jgi:RHS repeat-associated protein